MCAIRILLCICSVALMYHRQLAYKIFFEWERYREVVDGGLCILIRWDDYLLLKNGVGCFWAVIIGSSPLLIPFHYWLL